MEREIYCNCFALYSEKRLSHFLSPTSLWRMILIWWTYELLKSSSRRLLKKQKWKRLSILEQLCACVCVGVWIPSVGKRGVSACHSPPVLLCPIGPGWPVSHRPSHWQSSCQSWRNTDIVEHRITPTPHTPQIKAMSMSLMFSTLVNVFYFVPRALSQGAVPFQIYGHHLSLSVSIQLFPSSVYRGGCLAHVSPCPCPPPTATSSRSRKAEPNSR